MLVYLCTQVAVALSFVGSRVLPLQAMAKIVRWLRLERAQRLLACLESNQRANRLDCLIGPPPLYCSIVRVRSPPDGATQQVTCRCTS